MSDKKLTYILSRLILLSLLAISLFYIHKKWSPLNLKYRQRISINASLQDMGLLNTIGEEQTIKYLPLILLITNRNNSIFTNAGNNAGDLLFTLSDGRTQLPHDIVSFINSKAERKLIVRIKLPINLSSKYKHIIMYYGNIWDFNISEMGEFIALEKYLLNFNEAVYAFAGFSKAHALGHALESSEIFSPLNASLTDSESACCDHYPCTERFVKYGEEQTIINESIKKLRSFFRVKRKAPTSVEPVTGRVYIVDTYNSRIQEYDINGGFISKWGTRGSNDGQLRGPRDIAVYKNEIFITDRGNERVQVFDLKGNYLRKWGRGCSGSNYDCKDGEFYAPRGIAIANDEVYVVDTQNNRIQVFDLYGKYLRKWGSYGSDNGEFSTPIGIATYHNEVYVVDAYNNRVQVFDTHGNFRRKWGGYGCSEGMLDSPIKIAVSSDEVYVSDKYNHRIQVFDIYGNFRSKIGGFGSGDGYFNMPYGISVYNKEIFVADRGNHRIQAFDAKGNLLRKWGGLGSCYDKDSRSLQCADGEFNNPFAIFIRQENSND